ncbi:MAG: helix-turn-helix domain-containing protein [Ignavibacteriae bacterium]|nr:helix-turn-helix domain-containing protein [Ignavibacteriota bacterium]
MKNNELELITISKAAGLMHIGKERLYALINEGKIGFILLGKKRFIPYTEIVRYINESIQYTSTPTSVFEFSNHSDVAAMDEFNTVEIFNKIKGEILDGKHL